MIPKMTMKKDHRYWKTNPFWVVSCKLDEHKMTGGHRPIPSDNCNASIVAGVVHFHVRVGGRVVQVSEIVRFSVDAFVLLLCDYVLV